MYQIQEVLIPARFICYILQVLLTISLAFARKDFYDDEDGSQLLFKKQFWVLLSFFYAFEFFEFIILLKGYTLFINLLSLVQISFHSVAVLILNWFYRDLWDCVKLWIPLLLGGIIPGLLELYNLIVLCSSNRIISKIK